MTWKEIVQDNIIKNSDKIRAATRPLRDRFGIDYFTYHRIDNEGFYKVLVDRPDWAECYVQKQIYRNDPYLRQASVYKSGFYHVEQHGSHEYQEHLLKEGKTVLDVDINVLYIHREGLAVELFGFSANRKRSSLNELYLNNQSLLKSFSDYFKGELGSVLMEIESYLLPDLKGDDFFTDEPIGNKVDVHGFLQDLKIDHNLTPREKECLKYLLKGKSAKETGAFLKLSPRTIEFYLENIKKKWGCTSKATLFTKAESYHKLGLIP